MEIIDSLVYIVTVHGSWFTVKNLNVWIPAFAGMTGWGDGNDMEDENRRIR